MRRPQISTLILIPMLGAALAACGSSAPRPHPLSVTATDAGCQLSDAQVAEGPLAVTVTNATGSQIGVSIYARSDAGKYDKNVGSVDQVGAGSEKQFKTEAAAGTTYQVACTQANGLETRSTLTVEGGGPPGDQPAGTPAATAEVTLSATGLSAVNADNLKKGEVFEVKVTNDTAVVQSVYAAKPDGERVAGIEGLVAGQSGMFRVELSIGGGWTLYSEGGTSAMPMQTRAFFVGS